MLKEIFNVVGFHFPPLNVRACSLLKTWTNWEHDVQFDVRLYEFDRKASRKNLRVDTLVEQLTHPADIRLLLIAEDEQSRAKGFRRIFPTKYSYKYFKSIEGDDYYYKPMAQWESKFGHQRHLGYEFLKSFASKGLHLK